MSKKILDGLTKGQRYTLKHKNKEWFKNRAKRIQAKWRKANPEKSKENCREWYAKNRKSELIRAKAKFQVFKRSGYSYKCRLTGRLYRQTKRASANYEDALTENEWIKILNKSNHQCVNCGCSENLTMDHIIPISKKGRHVRQNIQVLCRSCNSSKGAKCG